MAPTPPHPARILIIDDQEDILLAARLLLKRHFASVVTLRNPATLPELVQRNAFDVLLLDMNFSAGAEAGAEGLALLAQVLALDSQAVVVLITAHGDVSLAVEAMKKGAADFVTSPGRTTDCWRRCSRLRTCAARGSRPPSSAPAAKGSRKRPASRDR
ncbi:MAG TPA: response regulator [Steroidobacteraceae bacterium]|nr:response regulator [Steroidobacteraceae bacterium]